MVVMTEKRENRARIGVDSHQSLKDWLDVQVPAARRLPGAKTRDERFQIGHLVEAVLAWFAAQPEDVRNRVVIEGRDFVRMIGHNPGQPIDALAAQRKLRGNPGNPLEDSIREVVSHTVGRAVHSIGDAIEILDGGGRKHRGDGKKMGAKANS